MKKYYITPQIDIIYIKMSQHLLDASLLLDPNEEEITDPELIH